MHRSPLTTRIHSELHVAQLNVLVSTMHTLSTAIDARDNVTPRHVRRVQHGTLSLARELGVTDEDTLCGLEAAALLHDTGKIAVPEHILNKPGRLTASEFETMKRHAPIGAQILSVVDCFDALTSDRPYRGRMTEADALRIVVDRRGTQYDPAVVDAFVACYERIMPPRDAAVPQAP